MANENYFLGLDIGTNSVGWAVSNTDYKLLRYKNNLMWGVHLFDEANPAADRRSHRSQRRRLNRRNQRIALLNDFFAGEILKTDPNFFMRLKESALLPEDFEHRQHSIFFEDEDYTDKEYYKEFPTIHHLICELIENDKPHDVRLVYLAVAYILKHRGHFLFAVDKNDIQGLSEFEPIYKDFYNALSEICGDEQVKFDFNPNVFKEILQSKKSVTVKEKLLKEALFGNVKAKTLNDGVINYDKLVKIICGGTANLSEIFKADEYADLENNKCCVKNADFSDKLEMLEGQIDELHFELVAKIKAMYDWSLLVDILNGDCNNGSNVLVSKSKVETYETHKDDLKNLKNIVKKYLDQKASDEIFKDISDKPNYTSYVYNAPSDNPRVKYKKCSQEDFSKFVKKYLEKIKTVEDCDVEIFEELKEKCETFKLCPKQVCTDNRVIPYQLYYHELKLILDNASKYLDFLNVKDEYGTVEDKILSIMEFRVPYYVGPLVGADKSQNAWLVRNKEFSSHKIYPWNFDDVIDKDKSEEEFIRRMTCKCTYMSDKDVLPKNSLLYCKFMVINEINNIKIKGNPISVEEKQALYEDKFKNSRAKLTKKRVAEYFSEKGFYEKLTSDDISGVDDNIKSSLKSYHDFKNLLSSEILTENEVESIIERITVTEDKTRLKKWLKKEFPQLNEENLTYVSRLKYKDYGRFSRELLEELYEDVEVDYSTGEVLSDKGKNIITMLWETNENFMELLSSKHRFMQALGNENRNSQKPKTIDERLKEMYVPVAVRRSITRTLDVVKDIKRVQKGDPEKIFIEMARGEGETPKGKRTVSRREGIEKFLNELNEKELLEELDKCEDGQLRSEKYYLYFRQLGKCMYTGKNIDFDDLKDDHKWNIDHIWPQAYIKDDSFDNKVLVDSKENGEKSDTYPINPNIQKNMMSFWNYLKSKNQISEKKYQRLIRTLPFTDDERAGFINRQLVETRQSTKAVATILKEMFPNTEIVYVKAGLASEFRQEMDMLKCRDINDIHHAKDAYLNIVLGNVYNTKFTHDPLNFVKKGERYSLKMYKKGNGDKSDTGLLTRVVERNGVIAWNPSTSFAIVKKMMAKNNIRYVRYCYKRKSGQNGGFFDQNPLRKKDGLVSIKKGLDTAKYGGFDNPTISFFCPIYVKGNGLIIMGVELMYADKFLSDTEFAKEYAVKVLSKSACKSKKGKKGITIDDISFPLNKRIIKINTVLEIDGYRVMMKSKTNDSIGIVSLETLVLDNNYQKYVKKIFSFIEKTKTDKTLTAKNYMGFTQEMNIQLYDVLVDKYLNSIFSKWYRNEGELLEENRDKFAEYEIDEQIKILAEMVSLLKTCHKGGANFEMVGGKKSSGVKNISSKMDNMKKRYKEVYIIDQSPSGLSEMKSENLLEI